MVFQTVIGPQMASEKNGQRQFKIFWSLRQGGGGVFVDFLKLKMIFFDQVNYSFAHFGKL